MRPFTFATGAYASGDWESASLVPANVIDALAKYTTLDLAPAGVNVPLESQDLFEYPFVYLTGHLPVFFTAAERRNLARFVERGGFVFVDDHNHDIDGRFHQAPARVRSQRPRAVSLVLHVQRRPTRDQPRAQRLGRQPGPQKPARPRARGPDRRALQQQGLQLRVVVPPGYQAVHGDRPHQVRRQHRGLCPHALSAS